MKCLANTIVPVWLVCAAYSLAAADDLYKVAPGTVDDPDIVWSRTIPIANQQIKITARIRGGGPHPVPVRMVLNKVDSAPVTQQARPVETVAEPAGTTEEYVEYQTNWTPTEPGMYALTVDVDPEDTRHDPVPSNNSATVTVPVVWRQLHIIPWGQTRHLKWITGMAQEFPRNRSDLPALDYWHRRGVQVLGFMYTVEGNLMRLSEQEMTRHIVKQAGLYDAAGADGLILDETGSYGTPDGFEFIRRFGIAYGAVHKTYPQLKVYNWIAGPLHPQELENAVRNDHLMLGECYEAIHARRGPTWRGRLEGYIRKLAPHNVIALGISGDCGRAYPPQIESSVRMIRQLGPDMPGICYYAIPYLRKGKSYTGSLHEFLDRLTFDYFIKPVLTIVPERRREEWDVKQEGAPIRPGDTVSLRAEIRNIGGMPARDVTVRFFARHLASGRRSLICSATIPQIGNDTRDIKEQQPESTTEKVLDGVRHPMGRFGDISRVALDRVLVDAKWTPQQAGACRIETEVQPSAQYSILDGLTGRRVEILADPAVPASPMPELAVTRDDVWVSSYAPVVGEPVAVQARIHNLGETSGANVAVKVYARSVDTDQRTLLTSAVIGKIGTDYPVLEEETVASEVHKIVDGTKYPTARWGSNTRVLFTRALVDATWTPPAAGYWRIEVQIDPSDGYTIRFGQSLAGRTVPVRTAGPGR